MKLASALFASALFLTSAGVAAAGTIQLDSYGTPSQSSPATPAGAGNSALVYYGSAPVNSSDVPNLNAITASSTTTTYDLTSGLSPWAAAQGGSYWVSQNAGNAPGGSNVEPTGAYIFYSTFTDLNPTDSTGTITVLADDTTGVYLNGVEIADPASMATAGTCDSSEPNCTVALTVTLPTLDFVSGTNYLEFDVLQEHGSAEGLDFVGQVNVTPEPNSLLLLGTGLAMFAGLAYSRRVQA